MTTLMQLRRLARSRTGVPISDDFFDDPTVDDCINMALVTLTAEFRWPWNERSDVISIAPGVGEFPVNDDWAASRYLFVVPDIEMMLVSPSDLYQWSPTADGRPTIWCPVAEGIAIRPTGGGDLRHTYYVVERWLADDDDQPRLPSQYTPALVAKAAELLLQREDNRGSAGVQLGEYQSWVARMRRDVRPATGPVTPRVRAGSWINV